MRSISLASLSSCRAWLTDGTLILMLLCAVVVPARAATLDVRVEGVRNERGTVRLCLWTAPVGFPDCTTAAARRENQPAAAGEMRFRLADLAPGTYAVTVFHDERNTGKVETNFLGIPRSGLGASNNPRVRFGPPSFAAAAFRLTAKDGEIAVRLVYP